MIKSITIWEETIKEKIFIWNCVNVSKIRRDDELQDGGLKLKLKPWY